MSTPHPDAEPAPRATRPTGMSVADLLSGPRSDTYPTSGDEVLTSPSKEKALPSIVKSEGGGLTVPASPRDDARPSTHRSSSQESSAQDSTKLSKGEPIQASAENTAAYRYTAMQQILENRENIEYKLLIREQPKHSRMCGIGEKADRRPIDPAPIIQLRIIVHDHAAPPDVAAKERQMQDDSPDDIRILPTQAKTSVGPSESKGAVASTVMTTSGKKVIRRGIPVESSWGKGWEDKTWYLENPYYFMYAMLADAETDEELHLLQDGKTRYTTGSCVSCLYHLKDIDGTQQGFFVFPDLSIRVEGRYRLKLCLFETIGHEVHHCKSVYTTPFNVYTAKRFPGMDESTKLSRSFADQGLKVRVRKNPRLRKGRTSEKRKGMQDSDDEDSDGGGRPASGSGASNMQAFPASASMSKRARNEDDREPYYPHQIAQEMPLRMQQQHHRLLPHPDRHHRMIDGVPGGSTRHSRYHDNAPQSPPRDIYPPIQRHGDRPPLYEAPFSRPHGNLQTPASEMSARRAREEQQQRQEMQTQMHHQRHYAPQQEPQRQHHQHHNDAPPQPQSRHRLPHESSHIAARPGMIAEGRSLLPQPSGYRGLPHESERHTLPPPPPPAHSSRYPPQYQAEYPERHHDRVNSSGSSAWVNADEGSHPYYGSSGPMPPREYAKSYVPAALQDGRDGHRPPPPPRLYSDEYHHHRRDGGGQVLPPLHSPRSPEQHRRPLQRTSSFHHDDAAAGRLSPPQSRSGGAISQRMPPPPSTINVSPRLPMAHSPYREDYRR